jgi:hypothetical protein
MAIGNEVSGECVEATKVVVEVPKEEAWLWVLCNVRWLSFVDGGAIEGG